MAGTVVTTEALTKDVSLITFAWTSASTGAADDTTDTSINAEILAVVLVPGTSTNAPSDLYDVTLKDSAGVDLLLGQGADLSNADTIVLKSNLLPVPGNPLILGVTNAGDTKKGTVYVYLRGS